MILTISRVLVPGLLAMLMLSISTTSLAAASAKENFNWYCAQCHGPEGKGDGINSVDELPVGPMNLSVSKEIKKYSNEQIIQTLTHGGPVNTLDSLMPPWGNRLKTKEIKELMKHVRSLCKEADCPK